MKKSLDDYRFELNIYLRKADCPDPEKFIEGYEKVLKLSEPIKFRHIGILRVPEDVYKACQTIVPPARFQQFINRLQHYINTEQDILKLTKFKNNISTQFLDLYEEWSNVTSEEAKAKYN